MIKKTERIKMASGYTKEVNKNFEDVLNEQELIYFYSTPIVVGGDEKNGRVYVDNKIEDVAYYILEKTNDRQIFEGKMTYIYGDKIGETHDIMVKAVYRYMPELFIDGKTTIKNNFCFLKLNKNRTYSLISSYIDKIDIDYFNESKKSPNQDILEYIKQISRDDKTISYSNLLKGIEDHNKKVEIKAKNYEKLLKMQENSINL